MTRKSDVQALAWMRKVCRALPGTSEGTHYGEIAFLVGGKIFATCGEKKGGPRRIVFRIDARRTAELSQRDPRFQRYPYEKSALQIAAADVDDWEQLRGFVEESYRAEARTAPRAKARKTASSPRRQARG